MSVARNPAIVDVLVIKVTARTLTVWKGIVGVIPRKVPMAVPQASDWGSPFNLRNLK